MFRVIVNTAWGKNADVDDYPQVAIDHPTIVSGTDLTGDCSNVTPTPNLGLWEVVCDQATLDAIEADPNYWIESADEVE